MPLKAKSVNFIALFLFFVGMSAAAREFSCTQVIGYSQVGWTNGGWYMTDGVFEETVGSDHWQLIWGGGAGVDRWQNEDYGGWDNDPISSCTQNSDAPDRVLLSVSAGYGDDLDAWVDNTDAAVATIRKKIPSARMIILQAVVGGPDHSTCNDGVRAARQHPVIDEAVAIVAARYDDVIEGYSPEVESCNDFSDGKGHLKSDAAAVAGRKIGEYYVAFDQRLEEDSIPPSTLAARFDAARPRRSGDPRLVVRDNIVTVRAGSRKDRIIIVDLAGRTLISASAKKAINCSCISSGIRMVMLLRERYVLDAAIIRFAGAR